MGGDLTQAVSDIAERAAVVCRTAVYGWRRRLPAPRISNLLLLIKCILYLPAGDALSSNGSAGRRRE